MTNNQSDEVKYEFKKIKRSLENINLISYLLQAEPSEHFKQEFIQEFNKSENATLLTNQDDIIFLVFETHFNNKIIYTCWAEGKLKDDGNITLSTYGMATLDTMFEYMKNLNLIKDKSITFQRMVEGSLFFIQEQVLQVLERVQNNTGVCFYDDMKKFSNYDLVTLNAHFKVDENKYVSINRLGKESIIGKDKVNI